MDNNSDSVEDFDKYLQQDREYVKQIPIVTEMLDVICQLTGMGFAAVARVTEKRWMACCVKDNVHFGLKEGEELPILSTLCNEIRIHRQPIVIDHVAEDSQYKNHHTPLTYGLQSYISYPIILKDGTFFGTLCAIDAKPSEVKNTKVMGTFALFAELLAFHLNSIVQLEISQQATLEIKQQYQVLKDTNTDLDNFVYTASHDLKSPLGNIESLLGIIEETSAKESLDREELNMLLSLVRSNLQRFAVTVKDLTTFVEADFSSLTETEEIDILEIVENVKLELYIFISESEALVVFEGEERLPLRISKKNLKSVFSNLLSNAIKYQSPLRHPKVTVKVERVEDHVHITISDNGLGIPSDKRQELFGMFKRFHDHVEGSGLGLYIVKRMIDKCNGRILVESSDNEGTIFTIII